jgi:IclR family pca regulon transcriptional regulator
VPKIIALRVEIGTRFPAARTSQGKVLLAALGEDQVAAALAEPSRSGLPPGPERPVADHATRADPGPCPGLGAGRRGAAPGVRSVAAPVRDDTGTVRAAINVTAHAAETSTEKLLAPWRPGQLIRTAPLRC